MELTEGEVAAARKLAAKISKKNKVGDVLLDTGLIGNDINMSGYKRVKPFHDAASFLKGVIGLKIENKATMSDDSHMVVTVVEK